MKILIVEDDIDIANSLKKNLLLENYKVYLASSAFETYQQIDKHRVDLVLLDWRLPDESGFEICRKIRGRGSSLPVIMLTALSDTKNKIAALDIGADDYITKPFEAHEVIARIKAVTRRSHQRFNTIEFSNFSLNQTTHEITVNNKVIKLSEKEFDLLLYFLQNSGSILSKDELIQKVWKLGFEPGTNVIEATIKNLRKKLTLHSDKKLIRTVYGEGYIFVEE